MGAEEAAMKYESEGARFRRRGLAWPKLHRAHPGVPAVLYLLALLAAAAPSAFSQAAPPPVVSFRVYRAIDSRLLGGSLGDAGTRLGNTNAASAGGVLGYLHTEVIPSFAVPPTGRRLNGIDAIAVFEVHMLNVEAARIFPSYHPRGGVNLFGPYMAFNDGVAMPPQARDQIVRFGAYVGIQDEGNHPRHAYPGDWYSFVGACPLSPWRRNDATGQREKPSPCPTALPLGGICPASGAPDGTPSCQYTYSYLGYVPLDDLVGITSKSHPLCRENDRERACVDYTDFQRNGGFEYSAGPSTRVDCAGDQVPESGLPFWRGRCDPGKARARIRALTQWSPLVVQQRPGKGPGVSGQWPGKRPVSPDSPDH